MKLHTFLDKMTSEAERFVMDMDRATPEELGLDPRCAGTLYVSREGIAAEMYDDRRLQYYGGFEYIDKDCRTEVGDYVFYTMETPDDDDRVGECIRRFYNKGNDDEGDAAENALLSYSSMV